MCLSDLGASCSSVVYAISTDVIYLPTIFHPFVWIRLTFIWVVMLKAMTASAENALLHADHFVTSSQAFWSGPNIKFTQVARIFK